MAKRFVSIQLIVYPEQFNYFVHINAMYALLPAVKLKHDGPLLHGYS